MSSNITRWIHHKIPVREGPLTNTTILLRILLFGFMIRFPLAILIEGDETLMNESGREEEFRKLIKEIRKD